MKKLVIEPYTSEAGSLEPQQLGRGFRALSLAWERAGRGEKRRSYGTRKTSLPKKSRPLMTSWALATSASSNVRPTIPRRPP